MQVKKEKTQSEKELMSNMSEMEWSVTALNDGLEKQVKGQSSQQSSGNIAIAFWTVRP